MEKKLLIFRFWVQRVLFFFPIQLILAHLKRSHVLIVYWLVLYGLVSGQIAANYGIPNLVLYPEYLGVSNFLSHVILGLAFGSFIMAFQVSSYIVFGYRFPFIATLSKPFLKYSLNNALIPLIFTGFYLNYLVDFQLNKELLTQITVLKNVSGFLSGMTFFLLIGYWYFLSTNKSIFAFIVPKTVGSFSKYKPIHRLFDNSVKWYHFLKRDSEWKIETYLSGVLSVKIARSSAHYNRATLKKVFQQNHFNASMFELGAIASLLVVGVFMESPIFAIPAGASVLLLFTMTLMLSGALHNWLKGWSVLGFVLIILFANELSKNPNLRKENKAYGLTYSGAGVPYSNAEIKSRLIDEKTINGSFRNEVNALNQWKKNTNSNKLFIVNTSGGGLRSALWTYYCLANIDSITAAPLLNKTRFISGASGGMIGASYYRELHLRNQLLSDFTFSIDKYGDLLSHDLLNSLSFSWIVNDIFRMRKFEVNGQSFFKDRAYYFENQLNRNTHGLIDKPLSYYRVFTENGSLPFLLLTPTIINDGRRLMVSSLPLNFMYKPHLDKKTGPHKGFIELIDFQTYFKTKGADSLRFTTALRMNSTFPFVLPNIFLPTEPQIQVMDAGLRDNFGMLSTAQYLHAMQGWIDTAIDRVVIIRIFDKPKEIEIREDPYQSLIHSITAPVDHVYLNMFNTQRLREDDLLNDLPSSINSKLEVIDFPLELDGTRNIPLSWQLTQSDKNLIRESFFTPKNKTSINRVKYHLLN